MSESVLLKAGAVEVTPKVARFGPTSYQIANIGSVTVTSARRMNQWAIVLWFASVVLLFFGIMYANKPGDLAPWFFGAALAPPIGAIVVQQLWPRKEFTLILKTSSGDIQALMSEDGDHVTAVQGALEEAFVRRT